MRFRSIIYAAAAPLVAGAVALATDQTQCGLAAKVSCFRAQIWQA